MIFYVTVQMGFLFKNEWIKIPCGRDANLFYCFQFQRFHFEDEDERSPCFMTEHSFSKSSIQLLVTVWDVSQEADAFEGNQIRYVQGCLGSECSLCIGTVRESVLENTRSPADIIVPIQQIVFCLVFNLYRYKHISPSVHQFCNSKGTGRSFPRIK